MSKNRADWFCLDCRIIMIYDAKNGRHFCPKCMTQVWHYGKDEPTPDEDEIAKLMREKYKSNLPAKDPIPVGQAALGGGGSKSKGRSRKGDMRKKSLAQINAGLNGKDMRFESR